ncbi:MAG: SRPBCC family protein [Solirubrobacteraceae bacterium]|nr:SRPBCC family protein [Solirubrobacteraceae bacterium]
MAEHALRPVDDAFLLSAPIVVRSSVDLDASPDRVWAALGSDEMWSWLPVIDRLEWLTPRPYAAGSVRRLRLGRLVTVDEEFYRWDEGDRATFRVVAQSRPVLDAMAEDFLLVPKGPRTTLIWTMALAPRRGASLPLGFLGPLLRPGNALAIGGIRRIL